jgi:formate dehydrogenase subunit delta
VNPDRLVTMANQIGRFFAAMPDRDQATTEIANHLRRTWEPRMRSALFDHVDSSGFAGLDDILREALRAHRPTLDPRRPD